MGPNPTKIQAMANFPTPTNLSTLRSFLGLLLRFVPNFAQKAQPLYALLKKGATWQWGKSQQNSVDELKYALLLAPTLSHDEEVGNLELRTDASTLGLEAVLSLKRETEE